MNIIKPSERKKKIGAIINGSKTVSFGGVKENGKPYSDCTQHRNEQRKYLYSQRHKKNEQWDNPKTAGFYSRWILWEKPTLKEAVSNVNKKFKNINMKLQKQKVFKEKMYYILWKQIPTI